MFRLQICTKLSLSDFKKKKNPGLSTLETSILMASSKVRDDSTSPRATRAVVTNANIHRGFQKNKLAHRIMDYLNTILHTVIIGFLIPFSDKLNNLFLLRR